VRLALVTEGLIHRSIDDLMDSLDAAAPGVRDLEVGTGGYSPLGHSPLELSASGRRAWHARVLARGFRISAFNVSGNPLHPKAAIARRHDRDHTRAGVLSIEHEDRLVAPEDGVAESARLLGGTS
jgi:sugar phosphate isomerase/epimerase